MNLPTNIDMYVVVIGVVLPLIISVITKRGWDSRLKGWVYFSLAILASIGHLCFLGEFSIKDFPVTLLKVLFLTTGTYFSIWRPTGVTDYIERNVGLK